LSSSLVVGAAVGMTLGAWLGAGVGDIVVVFDGDVGARVVGASVELLV
jgi:hypothetical protein